MTRTLKKRKSTGINGTRQRDCLGNLDQKNLEQGSYEKWICDCFNQGVIENGTQTDCGKRMIDSVIGRNATIIDSDI